MARRKARTMIADVQVIQEDRVVVAITHEDWQSFSRAVYPRADRAFREVCRYHALHGNWSSFFDFTDERTEDGRCVSLVHYRRRDPNLLESHTLPRF